MTMAIDQQPRHQLGSVEFGSMPYSSGPHFSNPWTSSSTAGGSSYSNHLTASSAASRASTMSMPYSSLPATSGAVGASSYSAMPYNNSELLHQPPEMINSQRPYESAYSSAPAATSSYAPTSSSYATAGSYGQPLAPPQDSSSRRISPPMSVSLPQAQPHFGDMDHARGLVPASQTDITPRNIYGPRGDRGSGDAYGFPAPHSASSSISSASGYPSYFGAGSGSGSGSVSGSVDGSVTDYSSASESVDGMGARTLPRPGALLNAAAAAGLPPAPASMMGSFNSKVSSSTQKKHKCKVCDKRFTRPSSLQTHMYSHTGEKPFACEVPGCGRNFSVVSNLRRHRKVHGKDSSDHGSPEGSWASHE